MQLNILVLRVSFLFLDRLSKGFILLMLCVSASFLSTAQTESNQVLLVGNFGSVCMEDSTVLRTTVLPASLDSFKIICFFSNSTSSLTESEATRVEHFVRSGGGLYLGSENWPLQAESNQLTQKLYLKESFGEYDSPLAEIEQESGNLQLEMETIPAGRSTVAFPMDYRLRVEAWVADQPLILSGKVDQGKVIIDGGYSRFYCDQRSTVTDSLWKAIIAYLAREDL
ncbi:MAG: hypothetical protein COA38_07375 [Fluviicola sp.]|nr:MAG: hypothetical protein COA38_07375 [Fluviicola sp.]